MYPQMEETSYIYPRVRKNSSALGYDEGVDAKVVIMGSTGVGKTSLLFRYTQHTFDPLRNTSTTGASFITKKANVHGTKVRLQLWDTAGQERFRSMAPMYYRGANAALIMYDITNMSSFNDVRGWLEELKKNCDPDLITFIVGSKADLDHFRQVTSDLARLSLHRWFPPARKPSPPPPPPPPSTLSYIRPRFTSFPSILSPPSSTPVLKNSPDSTSDLDSPISRGSLHRSNTSQTTRHTRPSSISISRSKSVSTSPQQGFAVDLYGHRGHSWNDLGDGSSNSLNEDEEFADDDSEEQEWGLMKGMQLFEVSAKDDTGINELFGAVISAIIARKDSIELENELKRRDSVFLSDVATPAWAAQADAEEARDAKRRPTGSWSCC